MSNSSLLSGYTNDLGLAVAYEYDPLRDLKTLVSNAWSTNVISTFAYTYDEVGRRTARIDDSSTTNLFGYNPRSELTSALMGTNSYTYAYDPIGNRTSSTENGTTNLYSANSLNQYTALNPATTNPTPFSYDADGNMTSDGRFVYTWNGENRMIMASNAEVVITYSYDYLGRMVNKVLSRGGAAERSISYIWDNWNIVREALASNNNPLITHNVWGLDLDGTMQGAGGVGGLLAVVRNDGTYLPTYDANGNVSEYFSGSNGTIAARYEYSSFGEPIVLSGLLASTFTHLFSTKPWCSVSALAEYQYRKYQPDIGRWMSRDPIGQLGSLLEYSFAGNNASAAYDILGLKPHAKRCDENKPCEENIQALAKGTFISTVRYNELFRSEFRREAIDDSLLPPERQYKKGRIDLRGREAWEGHKTQYEDSRRHVQNCLDVIRKQLENDQCDCCDHGKTCQWMKEIEEVLAIMDTKPPTLPTDEMWPVPANLPEIAPVDLAKKPWMNWRKTGWCIVGGAALAGVFVCAFCPFDGPAGEWASASGASAAFAQAATCVAPVIIVQISSDVLLDEAL